MLVVVRPELRDPEVRQRECAHLHRDGAVPALVQREVGSAECLRHVALEPGSVQGRRRARHRKTPLPLRRELVGQLVGPDEELVGALDLAALEQEPRHRERELGIRVHDRGGDVRRELAQLGARAVNHADQPRRSDDLGCQRPVGGRHRVTHCLERLRMPGEPGARLAVQRRELVWEPAAQLGAEHRAEERVVAEPGAARVERLHESVGSFELAQRVLAGRSTGERAGELAVQAIDDRRSEEKGQRLLLVAADHLGHQVVADGAVVAGEARDEGARVGVVVERQLREPEPRGPALGALPERFDVVRLQLERGEKIVRLRRSEGQVGGPDLLHSTCDPQALEPDRRVAAGCHHEPQLLGRVLDEPLDVGPNLTRPDVMEVVERDAQGSVELRERVADRRERAAVASGHRKPRELRARSGESREHVKPERPAVRVLARQPDERDRLGPGRGGRPLLQKDGLAGARGCGYEREGTIRSPLD